MSGRREFCIGVLGTIAFAQEKQEKPVEFLCPMDADVRQAKPGRCPRCGMKLVAGLPDPIEYPVAVTMVPAQPKPGQRVRLRFSVSDPKTAKPVTEFELIHERVLHLFLISEDLQHFAHEHPEAVRPGVFEIDWTFVRGGMWRVLLDFYPTHATPQLVSRTILLGGAALRVHLLRPVAESAGSRWPTGEEDRARNRRGDDVLFQLSGSGELRDGLGEHARARNGR